MRSRAALAACGLVVVALVAWALARGGPGTTASSRAPAGVPAASPPQPSPASPPPPVTRDIFRFGDAPAPAESPPRTARRPALEPEPEPDPVPGPRLVGIVRRSNRLVAALAAADGEVELATAGESAAGVLVLTIDEDSVLVRHPDGTEETLLLP